MSLLLASRVCTLLLAASVLSVSADIISDITTPETDEFSALQIKAELFWKPILSAAEDVKMEKHLELYADAETVINSLPPENEYVRQTLREALDHLKKADDVAFKQALSSSRVAKDKLDAPCDTSGSPFSFFTGGLTAKNFMKNVLKQFVGGGRYPEKLVEHVEQRQADILPVLRGAADVTGNILSDCRLASKKSFDVRKYDIYNKGVPKTPKSADDLADRIIDAASETRRRFTRSITDLVKGITRDFEEKQEDASVTVTKASLAGLHTSIAKAEEEFQAKPAQGTVLLSSADQRVDLKPPSKPSIGLPSKSSISKGTLLLSSAAQMIQSSSAQLIDL